MFEKPMGGTEIMYEELMKRLPKAYLEYFSIFNYIGQADFSKRTVFWNQLSHDQQAIEWMKNEQNLEKINHYVFVSNWQSENYRKLFKIAGYKTKVIKNACVGIYNTPKDETKIKICYTSTPWRGLDVLLSAWELLSLDNCELHVFSSTKIYGERFAESQEPLYQELYDKCKKLPNVVYRGSVANEELRKELGTFHIMAYPSTFEETSCISVIEAISNGLRVICSNLGALPETTEGWAHMYPYHENPQNHAYKLAECILEEIEFIKRGHFFKNSEIQKQIYAPLWSWDFRITIWKEYLSGIIRKEKKFNTRVTWDKQIFQECYVENEYGIEQLQASDVVVDLGTHLGSFALLAYDKGSRKIFSYEALKFNYDLAKENLLETNVKLFNMAVWRSDEDIEKLKFDTNIVDWNTGMGRVVDNDADAVELKDVFAVKFDSLLSDFQSVKILKIDIEGSEYAVLYTSKMLEKIECIIGEFHEYEQNQINGYTFDRQGLKRFLEDNNFIVNIDEANWSNKVGFFKAIKNK